MTRCFKGSANRRGWGAVAFLLGLAGGVGSAAEPGVTPEAAPQAAHVVLLDHQETTYLLTFNAAGVQTAPATFKKEPAFGRRKVFRRTLTLGQSTNNAIAFAWDQSDGKLHLDLNRNLDLTDDPTGVFTAPGSDSFQSFAGVRLNLASPGGPQEVLVDLTFYLFGRSEPTVQVGLRSFEQGRLTFQGRDWQVGVVGRWNGSDLTGQKSQLGVGRWSDGGSAGERGWLVLRPWEDRTNRIDVNPGAANAVMFPRKLFWHRQTFGVNYGLTNHAGTNRSMVEFREQPGPLGELRVSGSFIHRIVLEDPAGCTAVLDAPGGTVQLPPGTYRLTDASVKSGSVEATLSLTGREIVVGKGPTNLVVGGPLTNTVSVNRRGSSLVLNYRLVGADGAEYRLISLDRSGPPAFTVYREGKEVWSGNFEFG